MARRAHHPSLALSPAMRETLRALNLPQLKPDGAFPLPLPKSRRKGPKPLPGQLDLEGREH